MIDFFFLLFLFPFLSTAKPKNSAKVVTVQAGTQPVVVAQCEAVEGKPAASIKWVASAGGNHSTSTTNGPDGTVTVRSEYRLVPTPADNGREVTCLVDQRTQDQTWVYPIKLSVECKNHRNTFIWNHDIIRILYLGLLGIYQEPISMNFRSICRSQRKTEKPPGGPSSPIPSTKRGLIFGRRSCALRV